LFTDRRQMLKSATLSLAMAGSRSLPAQEAPSPSSPFIAVGPRAQAEASDTARLQRALDEAQRRGGGTVHIPAGNYVVGSLLLRSHVSIWLDNGATLTMSSDPNEFLSPDHLAFDPGANQATSDFRVALLVGEKVEYVTIYGQGIIECDNGKKGGGPKPIALRRCTHMSIHGITLRNAHNYNISMLGCEFVDIRGVWIHAGRADGIDPDCCRHIIISDCVIESVDDSLCLKASGSLGERGATEHITVTNCILHTASIHFKCGTESCGDFRNITLSNCVLEGGAGLRHGNPGIAFYTVDEGDLEDIAVSNITMRNVGTPLAIIRGDRDRCNQKKGPGILRAVTIDNVIASGAKLPSVIAGLPGAPVQNIRITGFSVSLETPRAGRPLKQEVPESPQAYPAPVMFGELPSFGLYLRHGENIHLSGVAFQAPKEETRPDIVIDDVTTLRLRDHERQGDAAPVHLLLNDIQNGFVECLAVTPPPADAVQVGGSKTRDLYLQGQGSIDWRHHLHVGNEVSKTSVHTR
jgi:hypothetical protein